MLIPSLNTYVLPLVFIVECGVVNTNLFQRCVLMLFIEKKSMGG